MPYDALGPATTFTALLVFARVGAVLTLLPGFSGGHVNPRTRLLLAVAISLLLLPALRDRLPPLPSSALAMGFLIALEALIGVFIGLLPRVLLTAMSIAGSFSAYFSALTSAMVQDPIAEQQSATVATFYNAVGLVLIFATDLHHLMFRAIVESYALFPVGAAPPIEDLAVALARALSRAFSIGLALSMPFLIGNAIVNITLGLLGRLTPQLNVMFFGAPIQMGAQLLLMMFTISSISLLFLGFFDSSLTALIAH